MSASLYWRHPFKSISNSRQLIEYTVMNVEINQGSDATLFGHRSDKVIAHPMLIVITNTLYAQHVLADVWLVKTSELGVNDDEIHTKTHLGHLLKPGDSVMCFNLKSANINEPNFEKLQEKSRNIPDVIIVKKLFGDKTARNRRRLWKLRRLDVDAASEGTTANNDFNDFMEDLEEDPVARQNVNIYKDAEKMSNMMAVDTDELEDETVPQITLQEMMDDLAIEADDDDDSGEDDSVQA